MDPARFYGKNLLTNSIPGDGMLSDDDDLDSESDVPSMPVPLRRPVIIPESDDESSDEDNVPLSNFANNKKKIGRNRKDPTEKIRWELNQLDPYNPENYIFTGGTDLPSYIMDLDTPADFFLFIFSDDLISMIVDESNLKSIQDNVNKPAYITKEEMEQFIGIVIFMSIVKLPATRMYWNNSIGQHQVYETMTCNRWETIKRFLHFNDNTTFIPFGHDGYDKLHKIRPLVEHIRQRLTQVPKEEFLAVDEQMIPTKGRHELKLYNPAKPDKWGYKNQVLSGASGFSYDFEFLLENKATRYLKELLI